MSRSTWTPRSAAEHSHLILGFLLALLCLTASGGALASPLRSASHLSAHQTADDGSAEVSVSFDRKPSFSARVTNNGLRLIVDIPNAKLTDGPAAIVKRVGLVSGVMAQTFGEKEGDKPTLRLLLTLSEPAGHAIRVHDDTLQIVLSPKGSEAKPHKLGKVGKVSEKRPTRGAPARVEDVRYERSESIEQVFIDLTGESSFKTLPGSAQTSRLLLSSTLLPEGLERTIDVSSLGGDLTAVSTYRSPTHPDSVIIDVDRAIGVAGHLERRGNTLVWSFAAPGALPSSATGIGADGGIARRIQTIYVEPSFDSVPQVGTNFDTLGAQQAREAAAAAARAKTEQRTRESVVTAARAGAWTDESGGGDYGGRRIDLDLKDADIHNVLRLLADVGSVNIVASDDVSGTVTIRMRNVPWDEALDVILQSKGLGMVRVGNIVRVAPREVLEKEREAEIRRRSQRMKLAPIETRLIPVSYATATEIAERAADLLSSRGSIAVDNRTNVLIVRDVTGNLNQIEELLRALDTQTPQVLIEARIVEATSRFSQDVGIQWGGDAVFTGATGNPTGLVFPSNITAAGGQYDNSTPSQGLSPFLEQVPNPNYVVNLPATTTTGNGGALGLMFGALDNSVNIAVRLSAAETSGVLRLLSSPRILTLDNQEARINQGTLIPYSVVSAAGVQTIFREAKLQLLVRPHVTAEGSIAMHVKVNRDDPDFSQRSSRGDPTILKREAETHLLVMDGHTAVIGGIYTRSTSRSVDQIPFLGDIPILGLLFQRRTSSDERNELVIFLTPRIVNRAEALGR